MSQVPVFKRFFPGSSKMAIAARKLNKKDGIQLQGIDTDPDTDTDAEVMANRGRYRYRGRKQILMMQANPGNR